MSNQLAKRTGGPNAASIQTKLLGMLLLVSLVPMTVLAVSIATGMLQSEAMLAGIVIQLVGLIVGYWLVSGVVKQSRTISRTLSDINNGNFEARSEKVTTDELGVAASELNTLCDNTLNLILSNEERDEVQGAIENLISEMEGVAAGDLTITTEVNNDITGAIAASVNRMTAQLRAIVQQVKSAAEQVTTSSAKIREASTNMSEQTDAQAGRIGEASLQLVEMTGSIQKVAALTKESVQVAVEARQTASNGRQAVSDTVEGMQRIRDQVQSTSKRIKRLGESSQEIGEIVQMISDITDRTSILALNASIQAAMAGDAGQGFAVVAEEIERLAESSKDATTQIAKLIRAIQNETGEVILDMEESTREVVAGSELASKAGETLFEIDSVSNQLVDLIQDSSEYALEQAETAIKVADSMSEISVSTKGSADKSREVTRSVGQLAEMVSQLSDSVSQFKVVDVQQKYEGAAAGWIDELSNPQGRASQCNVSDPDHPSLTQPAVTPTPQAGQSWASKNQSMSPNNQVTPPMVVQDRESVTPNAAEARRHETVADEQLVRQLQEAHELFSNSKAAGSADNRNQPPLLDSPRTIMVNDPS